MQDGSDRVVQIDRVKADARIARLYMGGSKTVRRRVFQGHSIFSHALLDEEGRMKPEDGAEYQRIMAEEFWLPLIYGSRPDREWFPIAA